MSLIDKAKNLANGARILTDWLGSGGTPVPHAQAQKRADTCLKCPHNVSGVPFIEGIASAIREQVELKNHLKLRVDGEKKLGTCEVCDCCLRLKVHVPLHVIAPDPEELNDFPWECWLVKESQKSE
jgi:hypothetical protein